MFQCASLQQFNVQTQRPKYASLNSQKRKAQNYLHIYALDHSGQHNTSRNEALLAYIRLQYLKETTRNFSNTQNKSQKIRPRHRKFLQTRTAPTPNLIMQISRLPTLFNIQQNLIMVRTCTLISRTSFTTQSANSSPSTTLRTTSRAGQPTRLTVGTIT